jgi:8-oxo-dGTP pyrophosphatase MutT (NUDIX family)
MQIKKEISAGGIVFRRVQGPELDPRSLGEVGSSVQSPGSTVWLVTQHSQHKGWVFPKGLVGDTDKQEKMEDAALREVEEEGGVKARIINPHPVQVSYSYVWNDIQVEKTVFYYLMEYVSGNPANHDWEMMDAKFISKDKVMKILTYPSDKQAFEEILKKLIEGR